MINICLVVNESLKKFGGHIGYSICSTERGNGYNKVNLYLGLKVCQKYGIDTVLMDVDKDNNVEWRTMESFGWINIMSFLIMKMHIVLKNIMK